MGYYMNLGNFFRDILFADQMGYISGCEEGAREGRTVSVRTKRKS